MTAKLFAPDAYRGELFAHCYRMLGSSHDADDALQETFTRAWSAQSSFDGRASLRTWLYRIATNACLDELRRRRRRVLYVGAATDAGANLPRALEPERFIAPLPERPDTKAIAAETVKLAFIAALQQLTPKQRAVLLLHDVVGFEAKEIAAALGTSLPSVTSALHRARAVAHAEPDDARDTAKTRAALPKRAAVRGAGTAAPKTRALSSSSSRAVEDRLLARYLRAWTAGDAAAFAALLTEDATFAMPPNPAWFAGKAHVMAFLKRVVMPDRDWHAVALRANGGPAMATYNRGRAHALHVITLRRSQVASIVSFRNVAMVFPLFGLPLALAATSSRPTTTALARKKPVPRRGRAKGARSAAKTRATRGAPRSS